jgi:hypothetical protein
MPASKVEGGKDPQAQLERGFMDEFVRARGHDPAHLDELPEQVVRTLRRDACAYAAAKLAEVDCRAHYLQEIHGE